MAILTSQQKQANCIYNNNNNNNIVLAGPQQQLLQQQLQQQQLQQQQQPNSFGGCLTSEIGPDLEPILTAESPKRREAFEKESILTKLIFGRKDFGQIFVPKVTDNN
jgi:hypothetical protein